MEFVFKEIANGRKIITIKGRIKPKEIRRVLRVRVLRWDFNPIKNETYACILKETPYGV